MICSTVPPAKLIFFHYKGSAMKRLVALLIVLAVLSPAAAVAQRPGAPQPDAGAQQERYDYWRPQRDMVRYGQQAILMCNGLFTGNRTLEQVFAQELAFLPQPVGTSRGGDYVVDEERKAVAIGAASGTPIMRAVYREGLGCVILAPDQTFEDIDDLPDSRHASATSGDPASTRVAGWRPRRGEARWPPSIDAAMH